MYTEFLAATLEARGQIEEAQIADAFDQIDSDDSGFISRENLRKILGETTCCSDEYIESLIKEADNDGDGQISYDEFRQYLTRKNTKIIDAILEGEVSDT
jgi:Ca2+-binding EF-hand superfamily protein